MLTEIVLSKTTKTSEANIQTAVGQRYDYKGGLMWLLTMVSGMFRPLSSTWGGNYITQGCTK